jgi:hypothetical protein
MSHGTMTPAVKRIIFGLVTGKGHRTFETGSQSVFLQVPEGFDVKKWASGQQP